jgi:phosphoribosyl-ATP pyrophosphohydrolase
LDFHQSTDDAIVPAFKFFDLQAVMNLETLQILSDTIRARRASNAEKSYTRQLLDAGSTKCAKKFGEEAVELVIASTSEDDVALHNETADVIYHLLVLLESRNTNLAPVLDVLAERHGISGLDEKASRKP